jgi:hypothetical protein
MSIRWSIVVISIVGLICTACQSDMAAPEATSTKGPSFRASAFTQITNFPIAIDIFIPCASGGIGEEVLLTGNLHDVFHVTGDGNGGFHVKTHDSPQGISGVGLTTGMKYNATGVTQENFAIKVGQHDTFVNNFRMVGQGPGNNFAVHDNFHITINANGVVTSSHDNFSIACK